MDTTKNSHADCLIASPKGASSFDMWKASFLSYINLTDKCALKYFQELLPDDAIKQLKITGELFTKIRANRKAKLISDNPNWSLQQVDDEMINFDSGVSWANEYAYRVCNGVLDMNKKVPCPQFLPLHSTQFRATGIRRMIDQEWFAWAVNIADALPFGCIIALPLAPFLWLISFLKRKCHRV